MSERNAKRRRVNGDKDSNAGLHRMFPNEPWAAATEEDKNNWKGWCEIESEPVPQGILQSELWQGLIIPSRHFSISCSGASASRV